MTQKKPVEIVTMTTPEKPVVIEIKAVALRIPVDLAGRVEEWRQEQERNLPGLRVSYNSAILQLIQRGLAIACVLSMLFGCAPPAYWARLPDRDKKTWERCGMSVMAAQCGPSYQHDMMYRALCGRELGKKYAHMTTSKQRGTWLKAHGCPPAMVEPSKH